MKKEFSFENKKKIIGDINKALYGINPFQRMITQAEYDSHDCTQTVEDGCKTCVMWWEQNHA